ncbi:hypothetical protein D1013_15520 [Euzebyella marina]|uniref:Anti-sigma factor n=1 Tax=Euzebyella marina TaxID=1761453 RepID=A0A3G2L8W6_9FLAO|nr:hypothetical protein [Euzebyella marina]AYN68686.1 hypothetical protein D1013_15520 [Euzebyella marina]
MPQDIRELIKRIDDSHEPKLSEGHERRFLRKLEKELPAGKRSVPLKFIIAASITVLICLSGYLWLGQQDIEGSQNEVVDSSAEEQNAKKTVKLGDLSPDLKKIESYYTASINYELSKLDVSETNKDIVDDYLKQLNELNQEYLTLSEEMNAYGPNDQIIGAMVKNLQLRLQLLQNLKKELKHLKNQENEDVTNASI